VSAAAAWLAGLTADGPPLTTIWGRDGHELVRQAYATTLAPPDDLVSSVRALVFRKGAVAVLRDPDGSSHVIPGGRREACASQMETLAREVGEETGWAFTNARPFGVLHFRHRTARPAEYPYPYPDFFQPLFVVEAVAHDRRRIRRDGWETHSRMTPIARALEVVCEDNKPILRLAVAARGDRSRKRAG
jgi:8-oxo-dGTP pyrophosphatase MutT (NUDIX family)